MTGNEVGNKIVSEKVARLQMDLHAFSLVKGPVDTWDSV